MVIAPSWSEPVATARHSASRCLSRGLSVRPTLTAFEGDEPTLFVRSGPMWPQRDQATVCVELVAIPMLLGLTRLLIVSEGRLFDPAIDDPVLCDALADRAVIVAATERHDDHRITTCGHVLPYTLGDSGEPSWEAPIPLPDGGPWEAALEHAARGEHHLDDDSRLGVAGYAYALSRRGTVVAVAPGWRECYGFDQPVDPRMVRSEDRRRARQHASRRRQPSAAGGPR